MNLNFTSEEKDFQQEVQQFLQQKLPKDIARKTKSALHLSKKECNQWQKILYKQGWAASNGLLNMVEQVGHPPKSTSLPMNVLKLVAPM